MNFSQDLTARKWNREDLKALHLGPVSAYNPMGIKVHYTPIRPVFTKNIASNVSFCSVKGYNEKSSDSLPDDE